METNRGLLSSVASLLREKRIYKALGILLAIELIGAMIIPNLWILRIFMVANIFCLFAISWDLQWAFTAQPNFGHALFFGGAAYISGLLNLHLGVPIAFSMLGGIAAALLLSLAVGYALLRVRGVYFAIFTMFLPVALTGILYMFPVVLGGETGLGGVDTFAGSWPRVQFVIVTIAMALGTCALLLIGQSDLGLLMKSMKENEFGAASAGVNITKYKIIGFVLSAGFAALAGVVYVHTLGCVGPVLLSVNMSFMPMVMTYIGGVGTLVGALIGAYVVTFLNEYLLVAPTLRILIYAIVLVVILRFFPSGIMGAVNLLRAKRQSRLKREGSNGTAARTA